ncbi:MAG: hypothetical protein WBE75_03670 [Candidatus Omnitrophota bacterium]
MRIQAKGILSAVFAAALLLIAGNRTAIVCASSSNEDRMLESFTTHKISVEGEIVKIKIRESNVPAPWEEMGIKSAEGKIYILIGKAVKDIRKDIGKKYLIKGMTKPSMTVKGEQVTVIELRSARILSEPTTTNK